jgi:hypothetical protein
MLTPQNDIVECVRIHHNLEIRNKELKYVVNVINDSGISTRLHPKDLGKKARDRGALDYIFAPD